MTPTSRRLSFPLALLLLLPGLAGVATARADWRDVPYKDIAKMPMGLAAVDPGHVFSYAFLVRSKTAGAALPADLQLRVLAAGVVTPLPVQPDGKVELPIRQDWVDAGAVLQVNQPKDRVSLGLAFTPRTPPGTRMRYGRLAECAPVMERGIAQMAGMMRFLAPKVRSLALRFDASGRQSLTLVHPGGKRASFATDASGVLKLPWNADWAESVVELSAPLKGIEPVLK
ncbi:hypothetical protein BH11PSE14_BH11PSE14_21990 [soil metagenome]